ncbi:MAG: hypothetical protein KF761_05100 [Salinibacterium sp.]|nr:hypothetical protein [Salinibacterium sp.]
MSNTVANTKPVYPWYAVPTVLAIIMLSSGGFVLLLAHAISIFSSVGY